MMNRDRKLCRLPLKLEVIDCRTLTDEKVVGSEDAQRVSKYVAKPEELSLVCALLPLWQPESLPRHAHARQLKL